jgi:hypothetical protein
MFQSSVNYLSSRNIKNCMSYKFAIYSGCSPRKFNKMCFIDFLHLYSFSSTTRSLWIDSTFENNMNDSWCYGRTWQTTYLCDMFETCIDCTNQVHLFCVDYIISLFTIIHFLLYHVISVFFPIGIFIGCILLWDHWFFLSHLTCFYE